MRIYQIAGLVIVAAFSMSSADAGSVDTSAGMVEQGGVHACDILTVDFIKEVLGTGDFKPEDDRRADRAGRRASTYSSCTVKWKSSKTREMEVAGQTLTVPDENRITLSVSIFKPGRGQAAYDTGVNHLKERNDHESVSGVGEEAMWFPAMRQISVRGKGQVFHLALRYGDGEGEPLEYAKTMAMKVLKKLE